MNVIINKLEGLCDLVKMDAIYSGNLDAIFEKYSLKISNEVCNIFINSELVNKDYGFVFLGYEALAEDDIRFEYTNRSNQMSFFGAYEYNRDFILKEDMHICFEDSLSGELENSEEIEDISIFFPLFKFQGDYIVIDMREMTYGALVTIVDGHIASMFAPSITAHIEDLLRGLNEGYYKVIDNNVIYPSSWYLRKKVRSGELEMDEYGECE